MREIYGAAFIDRTTHELSIPAIALLMLRTYILHYPDLQQALTVAQRQFKNTTSVLMAMRKATRLVNTFLDFHGLRHDHPGCRVWVTPPDLSGARGSDFAVQVRLNVSWSDADRDSRPTWAEFKDKTGDAIAWVLQQLIDYPQIVGIDEKKEKPNGQTGNDKRFKRR